VGRGGGGAFIGGNLLLAVGDLVNRLLFHNSVDLDFFLIKKELGRCCCCGFGGGG